MKDIQDYLSFESFELLKTSENPVRRIHLPQLNDGSIKQKN